MQQKQKLSVLYLFGKRGFQGWTGVVCPLSMISIPSQWEVLAFLFPSGAPLPAQEKSGVVHCFTDQVLRVPTIPTNTPIVYCQLANQRTSRTSSARGCVCILFGFVLHVHRLQRAPFLPHLRVCKPCFLPKPACNLGTRLFQRSNKKNMLSLNSALQRLHSF